MPASTPPGLPSLVDVAAPDVSAAKAFYSAVLGWGFDDDLDPTGHYSYAVLDGAPVAGLRPAQPHQPPAWTLYLATDDAEATAKHAAVLGGTVIYRNEDPGQGHVLVLGDPSGAVIGFRQSTTDWSLATGLPGSLVWSELQTGDATAVDAFYAELTGVEQTQIGDGDTYDYSVWSLGAGQPVLGRAVVPPDSPDHWLVHFGVDPSVGCDATVERARELGASVLLPPTDIPAGRLAVLADPAGAVFAVIDNSTARRD